MGFQSKCRLFLVCIAVLGVVISSNSHGKIIYVDIDAEGGNDGSSWPDGFNDIQSALAIAEAGDEIFVAEGVYTPSASDPAESFGMVNGTLLKGGYIGVEGAEPNERDIENYVTVLSGDLNGDDEEGFINYGDNSHTIIQTDNCEPTTLLEGFTITGGNTNTDSGAGMKNNNSNIIVRRCKFTFNFGRNGGAVYNVDNSNVLFVNCIFQHNKASYYGGAIYNYANSEPVIIKCVFAGNTSNFGGAIYNEGCSPTFDNCAFVGNKSKNYGGAIQNRYNNSSPTLTNCTFSSNVSYLGGGLYNETGAVPVLTNCILWGNSDYYGTDEFSQIYSGTPVVTYSCIQDGDPNDGIAAFDDSNIDQYPKFIASPYDGGDGWGNVNDDFGDLHIPMSSPCVQAGDSSVVTDPNASDIDGQARIVAVVPDMGFDEFAYDGDLDWDGSVDVPDLVYLAGLWLESGCNDLSGFPLDWCNGGDIDRDGSVNGYDFVIMSENWLKNFSVEGDFDSNRTIDIADLAFFVSYWMDNTCDDSAGDESDWCYGTDMDNSGTVDFADWLILSEGWLY